MTDSKAHMISLQSKTSENDNPSFWIMRPGHATYQAGCFIQKLYDIN